MVLAVSQNLCCGGQAAPVSVDRRDTGRKRDAGRRIFPLSSQSSSKRGSRIVLCECDWDKIKHKSLFVSLNATLGGIHAGWVGSHGSCGEEGQPGVTSGHRQALQEDVTLQPNERLLMRAYTSHLSVQLLLLSGRSYEGEAVVFPGHRRTELRFPLLALFSFPLGSEVLFGLVFRVLVYKHDFCSMGTGGVCSTHFCPFAVFFCSIYSAGEQ